MKPTGLLLALLLAACSSPDRGSRPRGPGVPPDGGMGAMNGDGGNPSCAPGSPDLVGCSCSGAMSRACWPASADPSARGKGVCKDGMQTCNPSGEFGTFGACAGAVTPMAEDCSNGLDDNCDGRIDCADPSCATSAACRTGCTDGQTRSCYDGPSGTENVGTCRDGTQTCVGGMWPSTCGGEVTPTAENCSDPLDHNCNHLPGCLDVFSCVTAPACQSSCTNPDPMCVCPNGSGDTATCPAGTHGVTKGGSLTSPGTTECCPCTASDCGDPTCCAETVCAGNSQCGGLTCKPLPASCNGNVNADCDDFPEDCDEPCCPCTMCP